MTSLAIFEKIKQTKSKTLDNHIILNITTAIQSTTVIPLAFLQARSLVLNEQWKTVKKLPYQCPPSTTLKCPAIVNFEIFIVK